MNIIISHSKMKIDGNLGASLKTVTIFGMSFIVSRPFVLRHIHVKLHQQWILLHGTLYRIWMVV